MRNVLVLIKGLGRGGAEQLLVNAAPHLDRTRFSYRVAYLLPHKDDLVAELGARGVTATCIGGHGPVVAAARLRRLVREWRIDVVHVHSPVAATLARAALPPSGPPIVYTEHNVWERYHPLTRAANALSYRRNAWVFTVSDEVRRSVRPPARRRGTPPPVETLYHGPDSEVLGEPLEPSAMRAELGLDGGGVVIGAVGNLKPHKGYPYLLDAASLVVAAEPTSRFVIVGRGRTTDLEAQRHRLGLDDHVVLAGHHVAAARLAGAFDVFTMSSLHEGLSIALLEAMAQGRCVVTTRVGGLPEVVRDGVDGLLVPAADPEALAEALLRVVRDPALRARLGDAARQRAAAFDIRRAVHRMEHVYAAVA